MAHLVVKILFSILILSLAVTVRSQASEESEFVRLAAQNFERVSDRERTLFEVGRFHLLHARFDEKGQLSELAVVPKYYFADDHPEFEQTKEFTNLSGAEFTRLRSVLAGMKPLGKLVRPANTVMFVTNGTGWKTEYYEAASLTWGVVVDLRNGENAPLEVRWFRFTYGANAAKPVDAPMEISF